MVFGTVKEDGFKHDRIVTACWRFQTCF